MPDDTGETYRPSYRLRGYDYSLSGYYFVTICTQEKQRFFGDVVEDRVHLNEVGNIVQSVWNSLPQRFAGVTLDEYMIMPNHVHGIVVQDSEPDSDQSRHGLGEIVRTFKAASTRLIRLSCMPKFAWQRDYYDHIIRRNGDLDRIREYIVSNPIRWTLKRMGAM